MTLETEMLSTETSDFLKQISKEYSESIWKVKGKKKTFLLPRHSPENMLNFLKWKGYTFREDYLYINTQNIILITFGDHFYNYTYVG